MTRLVLMVVLGLGGLGMAARSDEGMWLPNAAPKELLQQKYAYILTDDFLERVMKASVRFAGASGGFVSREGLIVTNHHVGSDAIQKLSSADRDLMKNGYLARSRAEELPCPGLELNVLQSIEDVTEKVNQAVKPGSSAAEAAAARRSILSQIEKDSVNATGLRSDVVTLYQGGLYHLYRYKKYTDVRLVFAPESGIASFGGDVDNFEYPRHSLDVAFFRAYENGQPAKIEHYFRWSRTGPRENDLVFVTGHPGTTNRLETLEKLKHRRDVTLPYTLARLRALEAALIQYSEESPEQRRQAANDLHRVANSRKAFSGQLQGLLDPSILSQKARQEAELRDRIPKLEKSSSETPALTPWRRIADAQARLRTFEKEYLLLERGDAFSTELFTIARHLVRLAAELPKDNPDRLREYRDSNLDSLKLSITSAQPFSLELEQRKLQTSLTFLAEQLGGEHPVVMKILGGTNPAARAAKLIQKTSLNSQRTRTRFLNMPSSNLSQSDDALIQVAMLIDAEARAVRKRFEEEVDEPERQAYAEIAKLRFATFGQSISPDATGTLRFAFGVAKGYEVDGKKLPFQTTFRGAFDRSQLMQGREPFDLPQRWLDGQAKLDLTTPFNFASTADTIGGNSGSPVLNRQGELIGVNFDRNRHGLVRNFVYTEVQARHIAVHCRAVVESLRKLYAAEELLKELLGE